MKYDINFAKNVIDGSEMFTVSDDPINAQTAEEAMEIFTENIRETFNPDFDPETEDGVYYATTHEAE